MFIVALLSGVPGDAGAEARVAQATGVTAYEARLALAGGFPAIVLTTGDEPKATALVRSLRAAGDDAVMADARSIPLAEAMVRFDRFTFGADAVTTAGDALPYADIACLLRAVHRAHATTETVTSERKLDVGKSLLSGGLANSKTVTKRSVASSDVREPVLYVYRRSGATPWLLRESRTHYEGLGAARGIAAVANFATTIRLLRERAPHAAYDERLVHAHRALERSSVQGAASQQTMTSSRASGVDILAHLLAMSLAPTARASPFRT